MKRITIPGIALFIGAACKMHKNLGDQFSFESCIAITFFVLLALGFAMYNLVRFIKWYIHYFINIG